MQATLDKDGLLGVDRKAVLSALGAGQRDGGARRSFAPPLSREQTLGPATRYTAHANTDTAQPRLVTGISVAFDHWRFYSRYKLNSSHERWPIAMDLMWKIFFFSKSKVIGAQSVAPQK